MRKILKVRIRVHRPFIRGGAIIAKTELVYDAYMKYLRVLWRWEGRPFNTWSVVILFSSWHLNTDEIWDYEMRGSSEGRVEDCGWGFWQSRTAEHWVTLDTCWSHEESGVWDYLFPITYQCNCRAVACNSTSYMLPCAYGCFGNIGDVKGDGVEKRKVWRARKGREW